MSDSVSENSEKASNAASEATATLRAFEVLKSDLHNFRCLVCKHDEFVQLDRPEDGLATNLMLYQGDDPLAKKHSPLISVACTRCGHIEQFVREVLLARSPKSGADNK